MNQSLYIAVKKLQINLYKDFVLFFRTQNNEYELYKPAGSALSEIRINEGRHPPLFIHHKDRLLALKSLQKSFNLQLEKNIAAGNIVEVKSILCALVEETMSEPRSGTLQILPETIDILVSKYSKQPDVIKRLASISSKDYTTIIHSVNVMALTIGFCFHKHYSLPETNYFGLTALLHDVGKTQIPGEILTARHKLTYAEFRIMKSHTVIGREIILESEGINDSVAVGAIEHHEKLDGSGYPGGITDISYVGKLIAIIDCYEALTNEDRPYRRAKQPLDTLGLIKEDIKTGKLDEKIFKQFCYSMVEKNK
ncbi:MAG: HD domain-containing protein [Deltaproteobacteria bacterium]|nr:HD domain-containing protein [Deltaproteobacteria bacterium]